MAGVTYRICLFVLTMAVSEAAGADFSITENADKIALETPMLKADIRKTGYVSGVAGGTFVDRQTGARDLGYGLDIVDWIMESGSDLAYRDKLDAELIYRYGNAHHGKQPKRSIEGPQICTRAKSLSPRVTRGSDFVGVTMSYNYKTAAPGKKTGSRWTQTIVFPKDKRYFISSDRIDTVNSSDGMFLRIDMPGHIKHKQGDGFSQIYLSYLPQTNTASKFAKGVIPASAFFENFAPDEKFNYRRQRLVESRRRLPQRFIRAYRLRDPKSGKEGPWLAGMTLDPGVVHEAWCHQRNYVCMIQEFGGRPIKAGESFSAAFIVGYFDSIEEMHRVYDAHRGFTGLTISAQGWRLTRD